MDVDGKEQEIIDNLYRRQSAYVELRSNELTDNFLKGVHQGCISSPVIFNEYMENVFSKVFQNKKIGIKVNGQIINNIRYAHVTVLIAGNPLRTCRKF